MWQRILLIYPQLGQSPGSQRILGRNNECTGSPDLPLLDELPAGKLEWIGVRPERKVPMVSLAKTIAIAGRGLQGDRRLDGSKGSARQVSIISVEFIRAIADNLGRETYSSRYFKTKFAGVGY